MNTFVHFSKKLTAPQTVDRRKLRMGFCRSCIKISGYTAVVLVAVLVYFHLECKEEKEENMKNKTNLEFNPDMTDCPDISLGFNKKGVDAEMSMGTFVLADNLFKLSYLQEWNISSFNRFPVLLTS